MKKFLLALPILLFLAAGCNLSSTPSFNNPAPKPQAQISTDKHQIGSDIKNAAWKIHRNEKYGFEISYPDNFKLNEHEYNNQLLYEFSISDPQGTEYLKVAIWDKNANGDPSEILKHRVPGTIPANEISGPTTLIKRRLNGLNGIEAYGARMEGHSYADIFYYKDNSSLIWEIKLDPAIEGKIKTQDYDYPEKDKTTYQKLLGSFKLIKQSL